MNKSEIKRKKIFDLYSTNLKWIKDKTNAKFNIEFEYGVLCPLCMKIFLEEDLKTSDKNHLTLEHNPPKSLGGKDNILTCKECNNKNGEKTDAELLTYLLEQEFKNFNANSKHRTKLTSQHGSQVTADLSFDENKQMTINLLKEYSSPKDFENFIGSEERGLFPIEGEFGKFETKRLKFDLKIPNKGDMRLASIALLKIGYLLGFEKYGHIFLFNKNLEKVREQILNPEKEIITDAFWINYEFPEMYIGVNIINKPTELRCFLNTFKLKTKSKDIQISIAFPGYNEEDILIYKNIKEIVCSEEKGNVNIELTTLEPFLDLKDEERVFSAVYIWDIKKNL